MEAETFSNRFPFPWNSSMGSQYFISLECSSILSSGMSISKEEVEIAVVVVIKVFHSPSAHQRVTRVIP